MNGYTVYYAVSWAYSVINGLRDQNTLCDFYLVYLNAKQKGWSIMKCVPAPQTHTSCASNLHFKAMCPLCPACKLPHLYKYTHTHITWWLQHQKKYHTYAHKSPCMCVSSYRHSKISHTHTHRHKQFELVLAGPLYFRSLALLWRSTMFLSQCVGSNSVLLAAYWLFIYVIGLH